MTLRSYAIVNSYVGGFKEIWDVSPEIYVRIIVEIVLLLIEI